jgi:NADPH:quinone reductase-like Zn-dependent oxidoreductase
VLVKVHATTVNRTDCGFRAAKPFIVRSFSRLIRPRVTVLGNEFAGVVEAVGTGVTSLEAGDRVSGTTRARSVLTPNT